MYIYEPIVAEYLLPAGKNNEPHGHGGGVVIVIKYYIVRDVTVVHICHPDTSN